MPASPSDPVQTSKPETVTKKPKAPVTLKPVKKKKKLLPKKQTPKPEARVQEQAPPPAVEEEIKGVFDHLLNYEGCVDCFDDNDDGTRVGQPASARLAKHGESSRSVASQKNHVNSLSKMSTAMGSTDRKRQIVRPRKEEDSWAPRAAQPKAFEDSSQQFEAVSSKEDPPRMLTKKNRPSEVVARALPQEAPPSLLLKVSSRSVEKSAQLPRYSKLPDLQEVKASKSQASQDEDSPDKKVRGQLKSTSLNPQNRSILDQFVRVDAKDHDASLNQTAGSHFSARPLVVVQNFERPPRKRYDILSPNLKVFNKPLSKKEAEKRQFSPAPGTNPVQTSLTFDDEAAQDLRVGRFRAMTQTAVPFKGLSRSRLESSGSKKRQSVEVLRNNSEEIQLMISVVSNKQENLLAVLPPIHGKAPSSSISPKARKPVKKLDLLIGTDLRPAKPPLVQDSYLLDSESDDYTQLLKNKRVHF